MVNGAMVNNLRGYGRMPPSFPPRSFSTSPTMSSDATTITTLDSTGRVVLPAEVRKQLRLATGARFSVDVVADRIELTLEVPPTAVVRKAGRLVVAASGEALDAAAAILSERQTQAGRAKRR